MDEEILTNAVRVMCLEAAPERRTELEVLWQKYGLTFAHKADREGFDIGGGGWGLIPFTPRTMGQVWILGFAAWKALEAYCPFLILHREIVASGISDTPGQAEVDSAFEDALKRADDLRTAASIETFTWPAHIPAPNAPPPQDMTERAVVDLIRIAGANVFLHEIRHVIFSADGNRPQDNHTEEIACDRFARDLLLERIADYCAASGYTPANVLNKRLMGLALGAFVVLRITRDRGGSDTHPAVVLRLRELVREGAGSAGLTAWDFANCILLSVLRREGKLPPRVAFSDSQDLFGKLVGLLEAQAP